MIIGIVGGERSEQKCDVLMYRADVFRKDDGVVAESRSGRSGWVKCLDRKV